jgi:tryptophan 2,3-dioxygenase
MPGPRWNEKSTNVIIEKLNTWLQSPDPASFPFDAVLAEYHRVGKHFVDSELLESLARVRAAMLPFAPTCPDAHVLRRFLDTALDKRDGRYEYPTYIGLPLLPIPGVDEPWPIDAQAALRRRDQLVLALLADVVGFELDSADGHTDLFPEMPPDARTVAKRCRHVLRVAEPALERSGMAPTIDDIDPVSAARELRDTVVARLTARERRVLKLSMLPVYVSHDEYLFIRVLQLFETTFASLALALLDAVHALADADADTASDNVALAEETLRESAPLFSLLGTMQIESFRTFRNFTDGASAIQSRNYKAVESICRRPDPVRLDSAAYLSTPEVRKRVLAGSATLDDAFASACAADLLLAGERETLEETMLEFSATLQRWRHTHYRLAVRMLGERTGTGSTEGAGYLASVRTIDVFRSVSHARSEVRHAV